MPNRKAAREGTGNINGHTIAGGDSTDQESMAPLCPHTVCRALDSLQWRKEGEGMAEMKSERQSFLCVTAREVVAFTSHC